jgi:xanthine dehydrogenase accessory factor
MGVPDIFEEIVALRRRGESAALATIVSRRGSTPRRDAAKMLIYEDGRTTGSIGGGCAEAEVCGAARLVIQTGRPRLLNFDLTDDDAEESGLICGGTMEVYVEPVLPDPMLFVFGAGHIGRCVAEAARIVGFKISVIDDRVKYSNRERFPAAEEVYAGPWEEILAQLPVAESSYLVIATRGHNYDLQCLRYAVSTPARYIGLLGSRRKTKLLLGTLEKEGVDPARLERVYAPIGLEIGSETPEEIAVSIVAELIAVRKKVDIQPLRNRAEAG